MKYPSRPEPSRNGRLNSGSNGTKIILSNNDGFSGKTLGAGCKVVLMFSRMPIPHLRSQGRCLIPSNGKQCSNGNNSIINGNKLCGNGACPFSRDGPDRLMDLEGEELFGDSAQYEASSGCAPI